MEVCDEIVIGPLMAQAILQRELYVRTKFTFKLSWEYCLLDPMDILTLTDANLGLSNYPVRIIEIQEDDKGLLSFTCEELVTGVSTPQFYASASTAGSFQPNWGVPALPINTPLIFEPNPGLTGGVAQVWFGASGIDGGGGSQWGGANVYISIDDVTYSQVAVLTGPMRQGFLTANLPAANGWDSVDTLSVNLAESGGTLAGTSQAAAQAGATLSLVGSG
jgi:Putative phage tail protein